MGCSIITQGSGFISEFPSRGGKYKSKGWQPHLRYRESQLPREGGKSTSCPSPEINPAGMFHKGSLSNVTIFLYDMHCIDSHQKLYQEWKTLHATIQKFQNSLRENAVSFGFSFFEVHNALPYVTGFGKTLRMRFFPKIEFVDG